MEVNIDCPEISAAFPDYGAGKSLCCAPCLIVHRAHAHRAPCLIVHGEDLTPWDFISPGCWGENA